MVSPAVDGHFSRMTISCSGDPSGLDQIIKQLSKLIDVLHCIDHTYDESVMKEMGLIKIAVGSEGRSEALQIAEHYGCKTVDLTPESMILQVVGNPDKIDALEEMIAKFRIIELVRTGKVVMCRGEETT
ncbi:MAG: acetolactate synthase small subunit [Pontiella sp.]|nr:acetolactate synthase small subunit [Pontiella sp.]